MNRVNKPNKRKPDWVPPDSGNEFASSIIEGKEISNSGSTPNANINNTLSINRKRLLSAQEYIDGVRSGNRSILAQAITLIESNSYRYYPLAKEVLQGLLPYSGNSFRIGITGSPGAGKSTFIDSFGSLLCDKGKKVAVLAVDPSSSISHGSILGDKTRMENLSHRNEAFIRPSATSGSLGGVARKTLETILLCEAAGFDIILIETVGVGQSEIAVRSMSDFYLLLLLPAAGDELQGIKKGTVELAEAIIINKADGESYKKALSTMESYWTALHYLNPATEGWQTKVFTCSAMTGFGIDNIWQEIAEFIKFSNQTGLFKSRRNSQAIDWFNSMLEEKVLNQFYNNPEVKKLLPIIKEQILSNDITPSRAIDLILQ